MTEKLLTQLKKNEKAVIKSVQGGTGLRQQLENMGIREGKTISIVEVSPLKGQVVVRNGTMTITIGRGKAEKILVETA